MKRIVTPHGLDGTEWLRARLRAALLLPLLVPLAAGCNRRSMDYLPCSYTSAWCGDAPVASQFAEGPETQLACPKTVRAKEGAEPLVSADGGTIQPPPSYIGAKFSEQKTIEERAKGEAQACCYEWEQSCPGGRPFLGNDGRSVLARVERGGAWNATLDPADPSMVLTDQLREELARGWLQDALAEHASVASFARATLELLALGAPPELVAGCQRAGLDEVRHARRCFTLATHYARERLGPGPIAAEPPRGGDHARLARDTFIEGCVGETIAVLAAQRALAGCEDKRVRRVLAGIVADESRHAALAWSTVRWALAMGGDEAVEAVRSAARSLHPSMVADSRPLTASPSAAALLRWGRLDVESAKRVRRDAWTRVIEPLLDEIVLGTSVATPDQGSSVPVVGRS